MAEENTMTEENKKTIVAFIAGLLVGGLLVFIFGNPGPASEQPVEEERNSTEETDETDENDEADEDEEEDTETPTPASNPTVTGGEVDVDDQPAGRVVVFSGANFPTAEGWVAVRDYANGQLGDILGAARWNKLTALLPTSVRLLRGTTAGNEYAIVFYTENGDRVFSLATDVQMSSVMETFKAE
jgi:hypothetical protein